MTVPGVVAPGEERETAPSRRVEPDRFASDAPIRRPSDDRVELGHLEGQVSESDRLGSGGTRGRAWEREELDAIARRKNEVDLPG